MLRHRICRALIDLLTGAGLIGMGLSLLGMVLLIWVRVTILLNQPPPGVGLETPGGALFVLDAFKEAGVPFLLSALLFIVAEMALRSTHRPHDLTTPPPET
ncbi:MAG TPA: hypothetical protein VKE74_04060 [Gemmataceae bacterium]|nr:hypothetical protein [Gemmataceae bacterium]